MAYVVGERLRDQVSLNGTLANGHQCQEHQEGVGLHLVLIAKDRGNCQRVRLKSRERMQRVHLIMH